MERYDVLKHTLLGAERSPLEIDEGYLAECLLLRAQLGELVPNDRGFASFYLLALHTPLRADRCLRTPLALEVLGEFQAELQGRRFNLERAVDRSILTVRY